MFSPRKWAIAWIMFLFRIFTGPITNKIFQCINTFTGPRKPLPPVHNPILLDSALGLARKIRTQEITSVDVVTAYIARIKDTQPIINAVVDERYADALQEAIQRDLYILSGEKSLEEMEEETPLLGVPFSVKEAISVKGMNFTCGVVERRGIRSKEDAEVVDRLNEAGAIPIVVTNTSEYCFWMETYNRLYGRTNNPYDSRKTAGGSSGGEGALIASAASVIGIGNDIGGSIRIPAFFNGIFGHKPSRGMVPNRGHFPPTEPVLQQYIGTGPLCRYACDLLPMLKIMAGSNITYLQLHKDIDMRNLKVYYMEDDGDGHFTLPSTPAVKQAIQKVVEHFRRVCDVPPQKINIRGLKHSFKMWAYAMSPIVSNVAKIEHRVFGEDSKASLLKELFFWLIGTSNHTLPIIMTVLIERLVGPKKRAEAAPFTRIQRRLEKDFTVLLQEDCVFIMPTMPQQSTYHYANVVRAQNCGYVAAFNILGLPATNCPVGLDHDGMPIGVQVVAGLRNDHVNLAVARELEHAFGGWVCPGPIV